MAKAQQKNCSGTVPPDLQEVRSYFKERRMPEIIGEAFYHYYKSRKWKSRNGCPMKNWKVTANNWMQGSKDKNSLQVSLKINISLPDNYCNGR